MDLQGPNFSDSRDPIFNSRDPKIKNGTYEMTNLTSQVN